MECWSSCGCPIRRSIGRCWSAPLIELVTGVGLWVLAELGSSPVSVPQLVVKSIITVFVAVLVVVNRKYASIPRGLWALIGGLTLANTGIAVFWQ